MVALLLKSLELDFADYEEMQFFVCLQLLKDDLEANLKTRFGRDEDVQSKALSTFLDPR